MIENAKITSRDNERLKSVRKVREGKTDGMVAKEEDFRKFKCQFKLDKLSYVKSPPRGRFSPG